ncbi:L-idonate 5-dehydrogenase [Roseitranquillus sediminis]|uniref:L-idonate 5-dehydrogenase n=1 Tax=Roseitranquillus sediminis TaxID=2809051 RepID=UPI001D0BF8A8|nr:L-idonate 5-dehydrogenase [Roseitranquillus sediminis]MBM9594271.1 L-idonate 5-dehydrogenase [Roseitranquillus sediminis]
MIRVCRLHSQNDLRLETIEPTEPGEGEVLVRVGAGGICGSDLHYFQDGGFGPIRVREPIILGHEVAGTVKRLGPGVTTLAPGDRVALNPSQPCGHCRFCGEGLFNHCLNMRFFGSALRFPHEQGAFRDSIAVPAARAEKVSDRVTVAEAACAEPLAVCLHAANQAGDLAGARVLVTGAGPIGALCVAVARHRGAAEVVATDLHDHPLAIAARMGATSTVNVARDAAALEAYETDKGQFDAVFECSAAAPAIETAIRTLRPRGRLVQVGVGGTLPVPINALVGKEIAFIGTHRFHAEFAEAAHLIDSGAIDVKPIITHSFAPEDLAEAFRVAGDRSRAVKAQLVFA